MISYSTESNLSTAEFISVLQRSTLGERRPIDDFERMGKMLEQADLIITARAGDLLVGVARSVTDFAYCTYLSDLAVDESFQREGIGKELIRQIKLETEPAKLILLSAPNAVDYYPKLGMTRHENCYYL